jgi:hypothetical protein
MFVNRMVCRVVISLYHLVVLSVCLVLYPTISFLKKLEVKINDEVNGEGKRSENSGCK